MSLPAEQAHIKSLYEESAKNDKNSSTLAQTLESMIFTSFKGDHKFIYELLQNADDASDKDSKEAKEAKEGKEGKEALEVRFILHKGSDGRDYLIFSHNGKHFSKNDVDKICDNSQQHSQDKSAAKKIGYKGIGFKSVFSIADCAHIISGKYDFRFDEEFFKQKSTARQSYPWPIIPIQNTKDSLLPEVRRKLIKGQVNFVLRIRRDPGINIEDELNFIRQNHRILLFLPNVSKISLEDRTGVTQLGIQTENNLRKFIVNGRVIEHWLMYNFSFEISKDLTECLQRLGPSECPERLKKATHSNIKFAVQIDENNKIIPLKEGQLFCYLPTQVPFPIPALINADFLLDPSRSRLVKNAWNEFLVFHIGYFHPFILEILAQIDKYRLQIFRLLPILHVKEIQVCQPYLRGFLESIKTKAFIPSQSNPKKLLKVSEVVLDKTGFYSTLGKTMFECDTLMLNSMESTEHFENLFAVKENFAISKLIDFNEQLIIDFHRFATSATFDLKLEIQRIILDFLNKNINRFSALLKTLIKTAFLLTAQNEIFAPTYPLYLSPKDLNPQELKLISELNEFKLIHPGLEGYKNLLQFLGIRLATRLEFIRGIIRDSIKNNKITVQNILPITHLVFNAFRAKELTKDDWEYLSQLPILTKGNILQKGYKCYLSESYQPVLLLENILPEADIFVSDRYFRETKSLDENKQIKKWKGFFAMLQVKADVTAKIEHLEGSQFSTIPHMPEYLELLKQEKSGPQKSMDTSEHSIDCFITVNLIEHATNPKFSPIVWKELVNRWPAHKKFIKSSAYRLKKKSNPIKTIYLQFFFQNYPAVPTNNPNSRMAKIRDVFAPHLSELIGDVFPVADLGAEMSEEQANFLGFKTSLTVRDCLQILTSINRSKQQSDPSRYVPVLKYLAKIPSSMIGDENLKLLREWGGYLLTEDNSLQQIKVLKYSHIVGDMPRGNYCLKQFPHMTKEEILRIVELFEITVTTDNDIKISSTLESSGDSKLAKEAVLKLLPIISLSESKVLNRGPQEILKNLHEKFRALEFKSVHRLSVESNGTTTLPKAIIHKNIFYFEKEHASGKTKYAFCEMLGEFFNLTGVSKKNLHTLFNINDDEELNEFLAENFNEQNLPTLESLTDAEDGKRAAQKDAKKAAMVPKERKDVVETSFVNRLAAVSSHFKGQDPATRGDSKTNLDESKSTLDVEQVAFQKVVLHRKETSPMKRSSSDNTPYTPSKKDKKLTQEECSKIGRDGERIVYEKLKYHYQHKYTEATLSETAKGFMLKGKYINKKTQEEENLVLEVIWHNKSLKIDQDSGKPYDFTIIKNGIIRQIEVKSTKSERNTIFGMSEYELKIMEEFKNRYRIFRVFGVGSKHPNIAKIKNPAQALKEQTIKVKRMELDIGGFSPKPMQ